MIFLKHFYKTIFKYDLLNKFKYNKTKNLPKIKKITLNFGCKNTKLKNLAASFLALEIITCQRGVLTKTKKANLFLKIRKGNPVGCKVILKSPCMFIFLERNLNEILLKEKNLFTINLQPIVKKNTFSYEIHNKFIFNELEKHYYLFNDLEKLDVTIVLKSKFKKELAFLLKSLKFY